MFAGAPTRARGFLRGRISEKTERMLAVRNDRILVVLTLAILALGFPQLSAAQSVARAELLGSWVMRDSAEYGFAFYADSTVRFANRGPQGKVALVVNTASKVTSAAVAAGTIWAASWASASTAPRSNMLARL